MEAITNNSRMYTANMYRTLYKAGDIDCQLFWIFFRNIGLRKQLGYVQMLLVNGHLLSGTSVSDRFGKQYRQNI